VVEHVSSDPYHTTIDNRLAAAMHVAEQARAQGRDPSTAVEIPIATDMAERVENLLAIDGLATRIRSLEGSHSREEAALALVTDFVDGTVGDFDSPAAVIEGAVRTAVALLTEGVVAAPIEGIDRVEVIPGGDGTEFVNIYYAGPIRSAGGTAQALSVLVADYARTLLDIGPYEATTGEVERYVEEVGLYDREKGLQYSPADTETRHIAQHLPIMLDGEPTEDAEVSGYRDLPRIDTNAARGGMCLVLAEGIALKARKIQRYTAQLSEVSWPWLDDLTAETTGTDSAAVAASESGATTTSAGPPRVDPSSKYLRDLIAGRPVIGHPSTPGGLRLRYGRSRNHGFATAGIHPATMHLTDDFLATGTQVKTERPGKAAGVVPVDTIEGPTVRLADGSVIRIDDAATAAELRTGVDRVIDLGEYLVNIGEFIENNQPLAPAGWATEWWAQVFADAGAPIQALTDDPHISLSAPTPARALEWADTYDAPLHPKYTYLWHDITVAELELLLEVVTQGQLTDRPPLPAVFDAVGTALQLPRGEGIAGVLERLLVEHHQGPETITIPIWRPLVRSLGFDTSLEHAGTSISASARAYADGANAIQAVNELTSFAIAERAPTRVGVRMGRPEKSERRQLDPPVHVLYPLDDRGGNQRDIVEAAAATEASIDAGVEVPVGTRACPNCSNHTYHLQCPDCGDRTAPVTACLSCGHPGRVDAGGQRVCPSCERRIDGVAPQTVTVAQDLRDALTTVAERPTSFEILKGVRGLSSAAKTPEPLEKGILRAKHGVSVFKDGTVRYDMTDLPVTAVRPSELDMTAAGFQSLGYSHAIDGEPLQFDDQLVELRTQDIILSDGAAEYLMQTAAFVDDLLVRFYDMDPFYAVESRSDLIGELVFGMAPHTSAAVVGRIVGFTPAAVGYAHPFFHAAKRRNCDGDEDCVMLLMDGLLNFSRSYLPDRRGGSMDAPLVMSSRIDPTEIDDEAHNIDVMQQYPRSLYEATRRCAAPESVIDVLALAGDAIEDDEDVRFMHTHDTANIAAGPALSAYKTLGSMMDKTDAQLELARKLRAVDATDVAERVIEGHFLPDLIGNLRAFASQESRCIDCERKYRRMPLSGSCRECGGRVTLTVHQGSVRKYLEPAMHVAEAYGCRPYTTQRLEVLAATIDSVFENDHNRQSGIADFM